jgi:4-hydroxy-3-methylbut-2-enyl diphosphate reductase
VAQSVYDTLDALGIPYTDATCPFVAKIHSIAASVGERGLLIVAGTPITRGAGDRRPLQRQNAGRSRRRNAGRNSPETLQGCDPVVVTAQTTFQKGEWGKCVAAAKKMCTNAQIFDTICNATSLRQQEAANWQRIPI